MTAGNAIGRRVSREIRAARSVRNRARQYDRYDRINLAPRQINFQFGVWQTSNGNLNVCSRVCGLPKPVDAGAPRGRGVRVIY